VEIEGKKQLLSNGVMVHGYSFIFIFSNIVLYAFGLKKYVI
jgi:hypothetical protein